MSNGAIWHEVMGQHADSLRELYQGLLGSRYRRPRVREMRAASPPDDLRFTPVRDLDAAVACAERLGSRVLMPITERDAERIAVVTAADGRPVGLRSQIAAVAR